ncbi:hypothetical protein PPSIR1_38439 [Plesiocystis pacifica SIR-1]|uniref:Uncharacterized protein n=1 Tax=Plesiocystis pacifica SIR-1 TaxID=391625 RepID=A6G8L1_9BACT|nr:hypothetical protein [Plesiocystis pacifica]EDM77788.1 hypothetical protein PPSIR1_38439 [Plesiocystis pacifica SIR-1]
MKIGAVLNKVYDRDVGWRPASGGIKPVHVANGLIRAIQGGQYDVSLLHEFVVWWTKGRKPDPKKTYEVLASSHTELYAAFDHPRADFERTRRYVEGLLRADRALFPSKDKSSFSLTHGRMVTADMNDRKLGVFGAALLGDPDEEDSLAAAIRAAAVVDAPRDPLSALTWPLLSESPARKIRAGDAEAIKRALKRRHNSEFVTTIQEAASCLATHERGQGNSMRTLQRAVQFVCVATIAHAQALAAGGRLERRAPALMTLAGHRRSDVAVASERSLDFIYGSFEQWLAKRLAGLIAKGQALADDMDPAPSGTTDLRRVKPFLVGIDSAKSKQGSPSDQEIKQRMNYFKQARQQLGPKAKPADVLARALVASYCREYESGGPKQFLRGLGCKVGLFYPHFQGATRSKRVRPSVPVIDMLVRACVEHGDAVPLDEFLERLWRRFGLIVGGRRDETWDDAGVLANRGLPVDIPALLENTERLVDELTVMGLARRYADDVTFVGDSYER